MRCVIFMGCMSWARQPAKGERANRQHIFFRKASSPNYCLAVSTQARRILRSDKAKRQFSAFDCFQSWQISISAKF